MLFGLIPLLLYLIAGVLCYLVWRLQNTDRSLAARLWAGALVSVAVWTVGYATGLTISDPSLRPLFEIPIWLGKEMAVACFLLFSLEYTRQGRFVRSRAAVVFAGFWLVMWILFATNPMHELLWTSYEVVPTHGLATVTYDRQPLFFANHAIAFVSNFIAVLLIVEAIINYKQAYWKPTAILFVLTILPSAASVSFLLGVGPFPYLNLTPLMFAPYVVAGPHLFFSVELFEVDPGTRRLAGTTALNDLATPVISVDEKERVLNINTAAREMFGLDDDAMLSPLAASFDVDIDLSRDDQTITHPDQTGQRTFAVSATPISNPDNKQVGTTLVFQDITDQQQREQRLDVLNRVLRHNLGNKLHLILLNSKSIVADTSGSLQERAQLIEQAAQSLANTSEKARSIDTVLEENDTPRPMDICAIVERAVTKYRDIYPAVTFTLTSPRTCRLPFGSNMGLALENLIENAAQHNDAPNPVVYITVAETGEGVTISISDNGDGVPAAELAVLETGEESALEHGSGMGLWIVKWVIENSAASIEFETGEEGTTARIEIPDGESMTEAA
jgi:signal transduction histidine kinase